MFLKISQNSQENTCARVSLVIKLQASPVAASVSYIQRRYSQLYQTSKMKRFVKIVDGWELLTTFAKQGSEYAYDVCLWSKGVFKALLNTYDRAFFGYFIGS